MNTPQTPTAEPLAPLTGSANPNRGTVYELAGVQYASSEARQAGAKAHPQWAAYLKWDRTVHCGYPDMDDAGDRMEFEAFLAGSGRDSQSGQQPPVRRETANLAKLEAAYRNAQKAYERACAGNCGSKYRGALARKIYAGSRLATARHEDSRATNSLLNKPGSDKP